VIKLNKIYKTKIVLDEVVCKNDAVCLVCVHIVCI